jgi:transmembrane sensor
MEQKIRAPAVAQAIRWYVRLRAPDCSETERAAFRTWLAQDAAHEAAFRLATCVDARVAELAATDPRLRTLADRARALPARRIFGAAQWRVAAALVLAIGVGALLFAPRPGADEAGAVTYANAGLQQQRIALADGSILHLDVDSQINLRFGQAERRLELLKGRAYFEVAHDASRPFAVTAGGVRTVALGTRFQVALAARQLRVTLAEGSVAIDGTANTGHWREILHPGQQLQFDEHSGRRQKLEVDAAADLAWSRGRLVFDATPLAEALDEINRYAAVKLRVGDAALAAVPIGGNFAAGGDSEQVAEALAAVLRLRIVHVGASDIVLYQRYETAVN